MPGFTPRAPVQRAPPPAGARQSAYGGGLLVSTGVGSLDEVLGGGLPVGGLLLLEQDDESSYADLVLRLFVAQGLRCPTHHVAVLASALDDGGALLGKLPVCEDGEPARLPTRDSDDEAEALAAKAARMKIAFRYQGLPDLDADPAAEPPKPAAEVYCSTFDLTRTTKLDPAHASRAHAIDVTPRESGEDVLAASLARVRQLVDEPAFRPAGAPSGVLRLALHSFASLAWGEHSSESLFRFLLSLRQLLRSSMACAVVTLRPSQLDAALVRRLEHASDSVMYLQSFHGRPDLADSFPRYAGILHVRTLPALDSLVPPSARLSVLRGTLGKADLAFRLKRRRFVVETLRLDVDGGVGERRTPKAKTDAALDF